MSLSKEELQRLAELEELEALRAQYSPAQQPQEESSATQAALSGAAQGATFGFSDELGATADVAGDVLTGGGIQGLASKWRERQKAREAANKADLEAHPYAYTAGEVGGGLATIPLMPGLGGAKLVGAASKLSPKVAAFLAGKTPQALEIANLIKAGKIAPEAAEAALAAAPKAGLATRIAGKASASAIEGAPVGALYGVGASEADLSKPEELASSAVSGAAMGSLGGLALGASAAGVKAAAEAVPEIAKKFDFTRKLVEAYKLGQEGVGFDTTAGKAKVAELSQQIPNQVTEQILKADEVLGKQVGLALDKAEQQGIKINVDPQLKTSTQNLFSQFVENPALMELLDPKSKKVIGSIYNSELGDLSPAAARDLKNTFNTLSESLTGIQGGAAKTAKGEASSLAQALDEQLKNQIPEYKLAAQKFANFRSSVPEAALQPNLPSDKRTKILGKLKHKDTELYKGVEKVFSEARLPGASTVEGPRAGFEEILKNLSKIEATSPEAIQAMGGSAKEVGSEWSKMADRMALLRQSQGIEPREGFQRTLLGQVVGSGEGVGYNIAGKLGGISKSAPVKITSKVFNAPNDVLMSLAQELKGNKASGLYGEALEKALLNKNNTAKNAALFSLLSIPEYRELLRSKGMIEE